MSVDLLLLEMMTHDFTGVSPTVNELKRREQRSIVSEPSIHMKRCLPFRRHVKYVQVGI